MIKPTDIFENLEYIIISYKGSPIATIDGKELNGKSKTDLQIILGKDYGEKTFNYSAKIKGKVKNETGGIRGIVIGNRSPMNKDLNELSEIKKELEQFRQSSNIDFILKIVEQKHTIELDHYKEKLKDMTKERDDYAKLYNDIFDEMEKKESNNDNMLNNLLKILPMDKIVKGLTGSPATLGDQNQPVNNNVSIHPKLLEVLNKVDYSKVSDSDINNYASILQNFVNQLPRKE